MAEEKIQSAVEDQTATTEYGWLDAVRNSEPLTSAEYGKIVEEAKARRKKKAKPQKPRKRKLGKLSDEERSAVENVKRIMKLRPRGVNHMQAAILTKFPGAKRKSKPARVGCVKPLCPHKAIPGEELCPRCKAHQTRI
jgi:hypothetical protein